MALVSELGNKLHPEKSFKSLKRKLHQVFPEDYEFMKVKKKILDPQGTVIHRWNKIFLIACIVSLFVDPMYFFLPHVLDVDCIYVRKPVETSLTVVRSLADVFYVIQVIIRFRTSYVAPSSRVFGIGELVINPSKISTRYFSTGFWLDFVAALPIPQFMVWVLVPILETTNLKHVLLFGIVFQYLPRLFLIFPLSAQIIKTSGPMTENAWGGAAYNLILYILASHEKGIYVDPIFWSVIFLLSSLTERLYRSCRLYNNVYVNMEKTACTRESSLWHVGLGLVVFNYIQKAIGALWYIQAVGRQEACWRAACDLESPSCQYKYFHCETTDISRDTWFKSSNLTTLCSPNSDLIQFGIYAEAVSNGVTPSPFHEKYFYSFFWGLKNLSCLGQNLITSPDISENIFAIIVAVLGLVLFGLLIGNMQSYLQSTVGRFEQWREKRTDTETWMHHRQLPRDLKQSIRQYDISKWTAYQGVDEEAVLTSLPMDLRKDIKRHICPDLVRQVPLFAETDERILDAICERLQPRLCTAGVCLVRELDPVKEMVFIAKGELESTTTGGGREGFFDYGRLGPGGFCGEEVLMWALDPLPWAALPTSTRTVRAVSEVEGFAIVAEDLRYVAGQFRRLRCKQLWHKSRFYSDQWRACSIQAAWRRRQRMRNVVKAAMASEVRAAGFVARLKSGRGMMCVTSRQWKREILEQDEEEETAEFLDR